MNCTGCGESLLGKQHKHIVNAEDAEDFQLKQGGYHAKCCPLCHKNPVRVTQEEG